MSETAKRLFQQDAAPKEASKGLAAALSNIVTDVFATFEQKLSHGATEIVAGLFTGNGFVLYGPGQNPLSISYGQDHGRSHEMGRDR